MYGDLFWECWRTSRDVRLSPQNPQVVLPISDSSPRRTARTPWLLCTSSIVTEEKLLRSRTNYYSAGVPYEAHELL